MIIHKIFVKIQMIVLIFILSLIVATPAIAADMARLSWDGHKKNECFAACTHWPQETAGSFQFIGKPGVTSILFAGNTWTLACRRAAERHCPTSACASIKTFIYSGPDYEQTVQTHCN